MQNQAMFSEDMDMRFLKQIEKDQTTNRMVVKFKEQITNFEFDIDDLKKSAAGIKGRFNQLSDDLAHTKSVKLNSDIFEKSHAKLEGDLTQLEKRLKFHETEGRDFGKYILRYMPIIM